MYVYRVKYLNAHRTRSVVAGHVQLLPINLVFSIYHYAFQVYSRNIHGHVSKRFKALEYISQVRSASLTFTLASPRKSLITDTLYVYIYIYSFVSVSR